MATLCRFCAKLNISDRCAFCGNRLIGTQSSMTNLLTYDTELSSENELPKEENDIVATVQSSPIQIEQKKSNALAIIGFVFSFFGAYSIFGLILSIVGLIKSKNLDGKGKGFSIAGIVISLLMIVTCLAVLLTVFVILPALES
ncbi:MAG: DUF4190 domain-containing protein [Clostridia bacterium]|nr:DUF4190 domain-containing protein [Clostridia bacterium]